MIHVFGQFFQVNVESTYDFETEIFELSKRNTLG